ncbi:hypothetical protein D9M68_559170 [compost metagenome]
MHRQVGEAIGAAGVAHRVAVDAIGEARRRPARDDRAAGDLVGPGDGPALLVQARREVVVVEGPQRAVADIFLAGIDHLDRVIHLLGDFHRVADEVRFQAPAEAAAEQVVVHLHRLLRQPGELRRQGLGPRRHLDAEPEVAAVLAHMGGAVDRLHAGVGEKRHLVGHLDLLRRLAHGFLHIAFGAGLDAFALGGLRDVLQQLRAGHLGVLALVPLDLQGGQALARSAGVVGDHRHRIIRTHHLVHALHRHGRRVVHFGQGAADHRADGQCGDLHPFRAGVDAEHRRATDLVRRVGAPGRGADQLELGRVLQLHLSRCRQLGGGVHQFAITQLAPTFRMHHGAVFGLAALHRHRPLLRRRRHQQDARSGASLAQGFPVGRHRGGTAGDLEAQHRVGVAFVVGRGVLDHHLVEAHFQFFRDQRRHGGVGRLPHFHRLDDEEHLARAVDADIGVGAELALRRLRLSHQPGQRETDQQAATHSRAGLEESPATEAEVCEGSHVVHAAASPLAGCASAATLMASRMRW